RPSGQGRQRVRCVRLRRRPRAGTERQRTGRRRDAEARHRRRASVVILHLLHQRQARGVVVVGESTGLGLTSDYGDVATAVAVIAAASEGVTRRTTGLTDVVSPSWQPVAATRRLEPTSRTPRNLVRTALDMNRPIGSDSGPAVVFDDMLDNDQRSSPNAIEVRAGPVLAFIHVDVDVRRALRVRASIRTRRRT